MKKKLNFEPKWFVVLVFFLVGSFLGGLSLYIWLFNGNTVFGLQKIHPTKLGYKFINPLLAVDLEKKEFLENKSLEEKVSSEIVKRKARGDILQAAVYFRDIENGRWIGTNAELKFSPGLLLKLPIMVAYYKSAESDPSILAKKLVYFDQSPSSDSQFVNGKSYTVDEIITEMVTNDNDAAAALLFDNINKSSLNDVYSDLGIDFKEDKKIEDYISLKLYSLFFRILYNATYLNREMSEKALEVLNQTPFDEGIGSGLPNNLEIAHKYRTRKYASGDKNLIESHDCGIIYFPDHPYLLCAMVITKDDKSGHGDLLFTDVSRIILRDMRTRYNILKNP